VVSLESTEQRATLQADAPRELVDTANTMRLG